MFRLVRAVRTSCVFGFCIVSQVAAQGGTLCLDQPSEPETAIGAIPDLPFEVCQQVSTCSGGTLSRALIGFASDQSGQPPFTISLNAREGNPDGTPGKLLGRRETTFDENLGNPGRRVYVPLPLTPIEPGDFVCAEWQPSLSGLFARVEEDEGPERNIRFSSDLGVTWRSLDEVLPNARSLDLAIELLPVEGGWNESFTLSSEDAFEAATPRVFYVPGTDQKLVLSTRFRSPPPGRELQFFSLDDDLSAGRIEGNPLATSTDLLQGLDNHIEVFVGPTERTYLASSISDDGRPSLLITDPTTGKTLQTLFGEGGIYFETDVWTTSAGVGVSALDLSTGTIDSFVFSSSRFGDSFIGGPPDFSFSWRPLDDSDLLGLVAGGTRFSVSSNPFGSEACFLAATRERYVTRCYGDVGFTTFEEFTTALLPKPPISPTGLGFATDGLFLPVSGTHAFAFTDPIAGELQVETFRFDAGTVLRSTRSLGAIPLDEGPNYVSLVATPGDTFQVLFPADGKLQHWALDGLDLDAPPRRILDTPGARSSTLSAGLSDDDLFDFSSRRAFRIGVKVNFRSTDFASYDGVLDPCVEDGDTLCLNDGRFRVEIDWRNFEEQRGAGQAVALTPDTGYFTFFSPGNVEAVVKVLDACGVNDRFWVFAGGLTNVGASLRIIDTATGAVRLYDNALGDAFRPIQDTDAFATCDAKAAVGAAPSSELAAIAARETTHPLALRTPIADGDRPVEATAGSQGDCVANDRTLCLADGRFEVRIDWSDFDGNGDRASAKPISEDTGYFTFLDDANVEAVVKVLDACGVNNRYWVFAGGLTNLQARLVVTDTATGARQRYDNPLGQPFQPVQDSNAFASCP